MNTAQTPTIYRAACSDIRVTQHGGLRQIPAGATIEMFGVHRWIRVNGEHVRCGAIVDGQPCNRALRAVAIIDSHKGTGPRRECGARCTNAIGPACDCKCRGMNHSSRGG